MKNLLAVFGAFLVLCAVVPAHAQSNAGVSASGDFGFTAGGLAIQVQFDARRHTNGNVQGQITLAGSVELSGDDVDGEGTTSSGGTTSITLTAAVDCVNVSGNRAAISGVVAQSSVPAYLGRRVLLAVEDGGEGSKSSPDRYTWGFYGHSPGGWVATDGELTVDPGAGLTWVATDAERDDDTGIPSHPGSIVNCQTFPATAYALEDLAKGAGNIQVRP